MSSQHENVIAIILFGSVARGQAREISDFDICVITGKEIPEPVKIDLGNERGIVHNRGVP
jgi:predicted nucleotidyltransferase